MKPIVRALPAAELDAAEAARWYEQQQAGLGIRFLQAIDFAVQYLCHNPEVPAIQFGNVRRVRLHRFTPYAIYYVIQNGEIVIFAVIDGRRNPDWIRQRRQQLG